MMPPEQETSNIPIANSHPPLSNVKNLVNHRPDVGMIHAEPPPSAAVSSSAAVNNVAVSFTVAEEHDHDDDDLSTADRLQRRRQVTPDRFSVLRQSLHPLTLKFEDVSYSIKVQSARRSSCLLISSKSNDAVPPTRTILNGVSGIVRPGELLAMLGSSGSGKTTLLTALAGRLPGKVSGSIRYNDKPFSSSIKRKIGFVPQDDVLYPHLTVLETLTYAALLRLPKKLSKEEKMAQAEMIIVELGLNRCRNSVIGGALLRGISGGERKRVSIGHEMIVNPSLLLLDEPTSGLDSTTANRIVATLRRLARGGRTVAMTIHQPSTRLYRMCDKVVVLSDGCPIYSGPSDRVMEYFGSIGYIPGFNFVNPADFLLDLANGMAPNSTQEDEEINAGAEQSFHGRFDKNEDDDHQNSIKQFLISSFRKNIYPELKAEINLKVIKTPTLLDYYHSKFDSSTPATRSESMTNQWTTSWWEQFEILLKRGLRERRHESYSGLRIFQVMSVSLLSGLLWWHSHHFHIQDQVGLLFFFSIFWGFFPLFNAIFAFPLERPILNKERSSGMYRLSSYFFARTAGDLPMELILPTIFITITYWMGGLKSSIVSFLLTVLIILFNVLVSQSLGLALGAILMEVKQATTLASVTMLVFLLAGGYYIQVMPPFISWLKYVSFSHYCYRLLVGVQYSGNEVYECGVGMLKYCKIEDFPAIKCLGGLDNLWWDVGALGLMLVGFRVLAFLALKMGQTN